MVNSNTDRKQYFFNLAKRHNTKRNIASQDITIDDNVDPPTNVNRIRNEIRNEKLKNLKRKVKIVLEDDKVLQKLTEKFKNQKLKLMKALEEYNKFKRHPSRDSKFCSHPTT